MSRDVSDVRAALAAFHFEQTPSFQCAVHLFLRVDNNRIVRVNRSQAISKFPTFLVHILNMESTSVVYAMLMLLSTHSL